MQFTFITNTRRKHLKVSFTAYTHTHTKWS